MNLQKKFGTFGGVFTPSVLTILGVIMYMRLGTVIGNSSSIFMFVAIILFAHVISITTGFSVSSIATDKKIKAGGIYYMLTRSLGFPIGGAIGITLFVATALSISLYLIGFAESMLPVIQNIFGIQEVTINHFRIVGSIALMVVLFVAYVSTSFAIKIQYVILVLIGLSLISIFTGSSDGLKKGTDLVTNPNFAVLFGIFFPAVTGFTAGVAMSGDLKNPSKSIPWGTMLAIVTGLVVYLALAFFLNASIDKDILTTNNNVLIEFGSIAFLVIAGVWGATLSSALGGILGGPRILQAMSLDNIAPKIFAVGHGVNNEPRNALILTFIISELGILIGELNVIAEIVAMFYMAAYLFINISCFLEQWASPDFRPKLKIPLWVSFVGAITTFLLMVQLNLGATLLAVVIMILIFFWLTRKELVLGSGDVWLSVWSNVVKIGLRNLYKKSAHKRNWQPNILLFSGATKERPHLIEMSKSISGRNGMVSNFDLIEEKSATILFPKHHQTIADDDEVDESIFHRRLYCQNIFKGIETIANTYGFSGIDPNTVLMGWARNTVDPLWFAQMTQKLTQLDYNILFLDYDKKRGFGNYKKIDIWWSSINSESDLSLQLSKLILHSAEWSSANIRILFVNDLNENQALVQDVISRKLEKLRIDISFEIIENELEQKPLYKLIQLYSHEADLIMMNLPEINNHSEKEYVESTNSLMDVMGTTLILKASSSFIEEDYQHSKLGEVYKEAVELKEYVSYNDLQIKKTSIYDLDKLMLELDEKLNQYSLDFSSRLYGAFSDNYISFSNLLVNRMTSSLNKADLLKFYSDVTKHVEYFKENRINKLQLALVASLADYIESVESLINKLPAETPIPIFENEIQAKKTDSRLIARIKARYRRKIKKGNELAPYYVDLKELASYHFENSYLDEFNTLIKSLGVSGFLLNEKLKEILNIPDESSFEFKQDFSTVELSNQIENSLEKEQTKFLSKLFALTNKFVNNIVDDSVSLDVKSLVTDRQEEYYTFKLTSKINKIKEYPLLFGVNQGLILNQLITFVDMKGFRLGVVPFLKTKEELFVDAHFYQPAKVIKEIGEDFDKLNVSQLNSSIKKIEKLTLSFNVKDELFDLRKHVKAQIENLSFDSETIATGGVGSFVQSQSKVPTIKIDLATVVENLFDNQILETADLLFDKTKRQVMNELQILENALELNKFTIINQADDNLLKDVVDKSSIALANCESKLGAINERFLIEFNKIFDIIEDVFVEDVVIERAKNHHSSVTNEKNKGFLIRKINGLFDFVKSKYSKTDDLLIQVQDYLTFSKYFNKEKSVETPVSILKKFTDEVLPNSSIINQLPFYYKQLFIGKHVSPSEPLENRYSEFNQLNNVITDFENGNPNVVFVSGESGSGKSFLINNVINCLNDKHEVYKIKPNTSFNSDGASLINQSLKLATNFKGSNAEILSNFGKQAIVFIEDYESWWKRTEDGFNTLNEWEIIFSSFSKDILFIIECNLHFLKLINQVKSGSNLIFSTVFIQPLNTFEIQKNIIEKNNIGGVIFNWKNKSSFNSSKRHFNRFFSKLNRISHGNIKWASLNWMASISDLNDNNITISYFKQRNIPDVLSTDWDLILLQVVIHKSINIKDLFVVFSDYSNEQLNENVGSLVRVKLLDSDHGILTINPYLQPFVIQYLYDKKILF